MATLTIEEGLYTKLSTTVGITNLISTRVYPNKLPQTVTLPAMTYQRIDTPRVHSHDSSGSAGTAHPRFQFDCWAETYSGAKAISDALRAALNGYKGTITSGANTVVVQGALIQDERYDDFADAGMLRISCDYIIWHLES
jgi:hypothetical protein